MNETIDQRARDDAKDAGHRADLASQLIRQHIDSCEKAHAENSLKLDKLEAGLTRVHARIDQLKDVMAHRAEHQAGSTASLVTKQNLVWAIVSAVVVAAVAALVRGGQ